VNHLICKHTILTICNIERVFSKDAARKLEITLIHLKILSLTMEREIGGLMRRCLVRMMSVLLFAQFVYERGVPIVKFVFANIRVPSCCYFNSACIDVV